MCPLGLVTPYLQSVTYHGSITWCQIESSPNRDVLGKIPFYNLLFCSFVELVNINSNKINNGRVTI